MSLREDPSLPLPASGGSHGSLACGSITPISASVFTGLPPRVSLCPDLPLLFLLKTAVIGFGAHLPVV